MLIQCNLIDYVCSARKEKHKIEVIFEMREKFSMKTSKVKVYIKIFTILLLSLDQLLIYLFF